MFALATQYLDPEDPSQPNADSSVDGNNYVEEAQSLLSRPGYLPLIMACLCFFMTKDKRFGTSHLSTCQALLLLGYRAIGLSMNRIVVVLI